MKAIFKREFLSAFNRLYAYITIALTSVLSGIMFVVYNLTFASESIVAVVSGMSVFSALVIPVVAVNAYPSKNREDTDAVYDMLPISSVSVVLGKYLASLAIVLIPTVVMAIYPLIAGMYGAVDHLASYSALFAYVLFESAFLAVCMFFAKVAKRRVWAYVFCYLTAVLWYLAGIANVLVPTTEIASLIAFAVCIIGVGVALYFALRNIAVATGVTIALGAFLAITYAFIPESFSGAFHSFINALAIFKRLDAFVFGVFDISALIFWTAVTVLFVFLVWRKYEQRYENIPCKRLNIKKATSAALATVMIFAALAVTCAAAVIPSRFTSFDTTLADKNTVSEQAKDFLARIDKDVTIYLLEPTGAANYELYLERLVSTNPRFTLKKVYYANEPEFYSERNIATDSISADSIVVECGDNTYYVSYYNLLSYSNSTLGATQMSYSEYQYYYSLFMSNEQYADYLYALIHDTTMYYNADYVLCTYIEYATADIIPKNYYLIGHGEKDINAVSNPYYGLGILELDISSDVVPEDAASIFINMPTEDITDEEKNTLIEYLASGGQITVITNEANLNMPNLRAVLAEYGMSANKGIVKEPATTEENGDEAPNALTEFVPKINVDNDILYYLEQEKDFAPMVKDANAIDVNENAKEYLTVVPLLTSSDKSYVGDNTEAIASYTLACAVETPTGAKLAWFTGGDAFNVAASDSAMTVMYALSWVSLVYETNVRNIPTVIYSPPSPEISAGALPAIIIIINIGFAVMGGIMFYKRKKAK